jgi:hypothetical protein
MKFQLKLTEAAQLDIEESIIYYSKISSLLKLDFVSELNELILKVETNPKLYQKKYKEIRIAFFKKVSFWNSLTFRRK